MSASATHMTLNQLFLFTSKLKTVSTIDCHLSRWLNSMFLSVKAKNLFFSTSISIFSCFCA